MTVPDVFKTGVWKHVVWTLAPIRAYKYVYATWKVYIDGVFATDKLGFYPANEVLTRNFIGKSSFAARTDFSGDLDTFVLYARAVHAREARGLSVVSAPTSLIYVCMCVCLRACACVPVCVRMRVYLGMRVSACACVCARVRTDTENLQPRPLAGYTWDSSLTANTVNTPVLDLTPSGITAVAPKSACKDASCAYLSSGQYFSIPAHNFGQYPGITISTWFKPASGSPADSVLFDLGVLLQGVAFTMSVYRQGSKSSLKFVVKGLADASDPSKTVLNGYSDGVWRHIVWSLSKIATAPATGSYTATWNIYINGELALQDTSLYPVDLVYTQNYIGKGDGTRNPFSGHLDSFYIFTVALNRGQARAVYANVGFSNVRFV